MKRHTRSGRVLSRASSATIESLQARQHLAVILSGSIIRVTGSNLGDTVLFQVATPFVNVRFNTGTFGPFLLSSVTGARIEMRDGNDKVNLLSFDKPATISGEGGSDTIIGGSGRDSIDGGSDADDLDGRGNNDTINGESAGDASILGGNDTIVGGEGDDCLRGQAGRDVMSGNNGRDTIDGGYGNDSILGGADNDRLTGWFDNDTVRGESGNDTIVGQHGIDSLDGGTGDDNINAGFEGVDGLTSPGVDTVEAGDGADRITAADDNPVLAFGRAGNDTLLGQNANDSLYGGGGDDSITGGGGNDWVAPGGQNDRVAGNSGTNTLDFADAPAAVFLQVYTAPGSELTRSILGSGLSLTRTGTVAADFRSIRGSRFSDRLEYDAVFAATIAGGEGNDTIIGSDDNVANRILGEGGADHIVGGPAGEYIDGGSGADRIEGRDGDDSLYGSTGNDTMIGEEGNDLLVGGADHDELFGDAGTYRNAGDDTLRGESGQDLLHTNDGLTATDFADGGLGVDTLQGDRYVLPEGGFDEDRNVFCEVFEWFDIWPA
jgi:Ca2+-binding RTX toxin-like protein